MVTNLVEGAKEKCTQYWPEQGSMEVGPFTVTITDQHKLAEYTIRTFILQVGGVVGVVLGWGHSLSPYHIPTQAGRLHYTNIHITGGWTSGCGVGVGTFTVIIIDQHKLADFIIHILEVD